MFCVLLLFVGVGLCCFSSVGSEIAFAFRVSRVFVLACLSIFFNVSVTAGLFRLSEGRLLGFLEGDV